ncbi:mannose-1-phosphate guanylyltransferase/mannose-6-phosphate isomerase [Reyranella sp.]|uniref:mannose-1-phosphate guanylyltransferase/mannose-6-phosphate isomerase n=1 Tax=Reyranella sp. TaxID=1929291 RepID=UPI00122A8BCB|nr:mannose-1-phosphate guanylyltransferase/mannose-6-phosphate isomerase [Reyranella sp.]TAJ86244.1 MAG: mannose-1-phosphate guanylyltransferase/mannose-6-phosphate isomerase [Reyranella sp.]
MDTIPDLGRFHQQGSAQIHPVILSGGAGTRLWPLSRASYPKQLLKLVSDRTLLQETAMRGLVDVGFAAPVVVCNLEHRFLVADQLEEVGIKPQTLLLEPLARNTGPAIATAALWLLRQDPEALMLVQPSDHVIATLPPFHQAVMQGMAAARAGRLVTFGIKPSRPDTGYGYIQGGTPLEGNDGVLDVERFVEKPDRDTAQRFVDSGAFFWNSGIFLLGARAYLDELASINPAMLDACRTALESARGEADCHHLDAEAFGRAPALSIDHAVMEHTDHAAVVPVDMAWNDVGSWPALHGVATGDADGNVIQGDVVQDGVSNSYLRSEGRLLAAVGLDGITVVATDDAVLVAGADSAGAVSRIVQRLRRENRSEPLRHSTCHRPWGNYRTIDAGNRFQVKHISVKPGGKLSLQKHYHRAEHWVVVHGTAIVQCGEERRLLHENQSIYIPIGTEHRLENPGKLTLELIEVQSGGYLGEDDIVRLSDNYGRV